MSKIKVIVIVGPTASGKTSLGIHIAKQFNGEVVSGDSMQIYENMDIATAKPTLEEMDGIKHHLIGFVNPQNEYSVASFCEDAKNAVEEIVRSGKTPVIVGGTGLYIDSFINNITFFDDANSPEIREQLYKELNEFGIEKLYNELLLVDSEAAKKIHPNNEVKVIRALEIYRSTGKNLTEQNKQSRNIESEYEPLYIGISYKDREKLYERINKRVDIMLQNGLLEEAKDLIKKLKQLDGDTEVYTEQYSSYDINSVLVARNKKTGRIHAYVGDDFDSVKQELAEDGFDAKEI